MRKLISLFFLLVFCFSITSFSAEIHFCSGKISDVSFIGESSCDNCVNDNNHCKMHKKKMNCCDTTVITHYGAEDVLDSGISIQIASQLAIIVVQYYFETNLFVSVSNDNHPQDNYRSPHIDEDISVLIQSILI